MYLGVDLGTSFSQVAVDNNNHVLRLVSAGVYGLPSSFYYDDIDGEVVGEEAENLAQGFNAANVLREVKMKLGQRFVIGGREFSSDEIVQKIYRAILEQADDEGRKNIMDFTIDGIVITHPAKFNIKEINTLCEAAKNAIDTQAVPVVGALKEPVAAAISYYRDARDNFDNGDGIIVFDLGGGTCDVALVQVDENDDAEYRVADSDMIRVGGRDWDKVLYDYAIEKISAGTNGAVNIVGDAAMENDLRKAVNTAKHHLSKKEECLIRPTISALYSYSRLSRGIQITRSKFEELSSGLLSDAIDLLDRVYQRNRDSVKIKEIICVGGASNMPQIGEAIRNKFTDCVVRIYKPEYATVNGAAIFAGKIMNKMIENGYGLNPSENDPIIERTTGVVIRDIIEDTLPFSYGIRCREFVGSNNFVVHNILKKGDTLPATGSYDNFRLVGSGTSVKIEVYESECSELNYPLNGSVNSEEVGHILLEIPNGIMEGVQVECALMMNSLDNIQLEAHDENGNHIKAEFKIAK